MGRMLRKRLLLSVFLSCCFLLGGALESYSQSSLQPGDITIIGFNGDGDYEISFVTFKDIPEGTSIYFRDDEWDGASESFATGEGDITYDVPSGGLSKGEVVEINPTTETSSNGGTVNEVGSYNFSASGDQLYCYLSTESTYPEDNPTTFLFAITTNSSWPSNQLTNTGLIAGTDALSNIGGTDNQDNGEYIGSRKGTTSQIKSLIQDVNAEWNTTNGNSDQSIDFDNTSFSLVDPPTIAFSSEIFSGVEGTTANITVKLVESTGSKVNLEVAFSDDPSTAEVSDIDSYSTTNITFQATDTDGETRTVPITLSDDGKYEGEEKAVFELQGISSGTIIEPSILTLNITDNDSPDIVINEIYYAPSTNDANNDGASVDSNDEFVELVNNSTKDIDISGWKLFDGAGDKYTFPDGTVIPDNRAFVVFADPAQGSNYGGALLYSAGSLGLNNTGDDVILKDADGNTVDQVLGFSDSVNDESITRNKDLTGSFEPHTSADAAGDGSPYSPGTKIDGTPFGSKHAIAFRGTEGWRMVSSPAQDASIEDLFGDLWIQGISGSDDPQGEGTIFSWNADLVEFNDPNGIGYALTAGKGYIVYVFEDDEYSTPGIQGGFPKVINTNKAENSSPVTVSVRSNDKDNSGTIDGNEGYNLLGNPYSTDISASKVIDELESIPNATVNTNIHIWDHEANGGNGGYITLDGTDGSTDRIAPFQAFFVRLTNDGTATNIDLTRSDLAVNEGTDFYKNAADDPLSFNLELHGEDGYFDTYSLEFSDKGSLELDRYDAYKLFSLNSNSINLFSTINNNRLQKNVLPKKLDSNLEIPLSFDAAGRTSLVFRWNNKMEKIPSDWELLLIDKEQNREIDLRRSKEYKFSVSGGQQRQKTNGTSDQNDLMNKANNVQENRFVLAIKPKQKGIATNPDIPESVKLNPNYPNPFNPSTTIPYEITEDAEVKLTVWNMIGQKVATLVDGPVEAGSHEETWNASDMPSGIYIARFEVAGKVFTRKMTLIK